MVTFYRRELICKGTTEWFVFITLDKEASHCHVIRQRPIERTRRVLSADAAEQL